MSELRAATIYQPFADLIVGDVKDVENRSRPPTWWDLPDWYACVEGCGHRMRRTQSHLDPVAHHYRTPDQVVGGEWHDVEPDGPYPFRLAVHAAQSVYSFDADADIRHRDEVNEARRRLPYYPADVDWHLGVILGTVEVTGSHYADECAYHPGCTCPMTGSYASLHDADCLAHDEAARWYCSRWAEPDCHHWTLADPRPLDDPIPAKGQQGLWRVDGDVADRLRGVAA